MKPDDGHRLCTPSFSLILAATASAQVDARMFRQPTVSQTQIAFVYAGDIWIVSRKGGTATRLSSPQGEESFPRFSPDGTKHRLQRRLRRQYRRLRGRRQRRRAGAPHASSDGGPRDRLAPRRQARAVCLEPRERPAALQSVLSRRPRRRAAREAAGALRRIRRHCRERHRLRLHADVAGLPHLEALSRRLGAGPVALQPQDLRVAQPDERSRQRRAADVARQHDLLRLRSRRRRSATTSGRSTSRRARRGRSRSSRTSTSRSPRLAPMRSCSRPAAGCISSTVAPRRRPRCPIRVVTDETTLRPRTAKAEALISDASISPTGKRAAFGARGDVVTVPAENGAVVNLTRYVRRRRALSALVARWQDGRLLERQERRIRADAAPGRRIGRRAEGDVARRRVPLHAVLVARQQEARVHRSGDEDSHLRRRGEPGDRRSTRVPTGSATAASSRSASSGRPTRGG